MHSIRGNQVRQFWLLRRHRSDSALNEIQFLLFCRQHGVWLEKGKIIDAGVLDFGHLLDSQLLKLSHYARRYYGDPKRFASLKPLAEDYYQAVLSLKRVAGISPTGDNMVRKASANTIEVAKRALRHLDAPARLRDPRLKGSVRVPKTRVPEEFFPKPQVRRNSRRTIRLR